MVSLLDKCDCVHTHPHIVHTCNAHMHTRRTDTHSHTMQTHNAHTQYTQCTHSHIHSHLDAIALHVCYYRLENHYYQDACAPTVTIKPADPAGYQDEAIIDMNEEEFASFEAQERCKVSERWLLLEHNGG